MHYFSIKLPAYKQSTLVAPGLGMRECTIWRLLWKFLYYTIYNIWFFLLFACLVLLTTWPWLIAAWYKRSSRLSCKEKFNQADDLFSMRQPLPVLKQENRWNSMDFTAGEKHKQTTVTFKEPSSRNENCTSHDQFKLSKLCYKTNAANRTKT